jgi:RimJ/RimL family protein N-acetyltransferase
VAVNDGAARPLPQPSTRATGLTVAPVLDTGRLRLRSYTAGDLDDMAALRADPVVMRYIGGKTQTRVETWSRLLRCAGSWPLVGFGFWAVEEREAARYVGEVALFDALRDVEPRIEVLETGWIFAPWAQGRGYATEAVRAMLAWSDAQPGMADTACIVDAANGASQRVAIKCGYVEQRRFDYEGDATIFYTRRG